MKKINRFSLNILLTLFITSIFFYIRSIYQHQFGGYDLSILIDIDHRLINGEKPGIDFISTYPISFIYWLKISLLIFPNNWNSLFYSGFLHFLLCIIAIYAVLYYNTTFKRATILIIGIIFSVPLFVTNHIWPSYFSEYNAIVIYITLSIIILSGKIKTIDYVIFALFSGFSLLSKQNIGLFTSFLYAVVLFICFLNDLIPKKQFVNLILVTIVSTVVYIITIYGFLGMNTMGIIKTYTAVSARILPAKEQIIDVFLWNENLWVCLIMFVFGLLTLIPAVKILRTSDVNKHIKVFIWFNIFIQLIGYYAVLTNWDTKLNDFAFIAISNLLVLFAINKKVLSFAYTGFIFAIFCYSFYLGTIRYRMRNVGVGAFYEPVANYEIKKGYLNGVYCGPILYHADQELLNMKKSGFLNKRVFFGPRMEFGYEQYQLQSPPHMPIWWHPGSSYAIKDEIAVIDTFKKLKFDKLIFLKNDRTRMPAQLLKYINLNYCRSKPSAYLDIYSHN